MIVEALQAFDGKILLVCTKFSHKSQKTIGLTNYFYAKVGVGITGIQTGANTLNYFHQIFAEKTSVYLIVINMVWFWILFNDSLACSKAEEKLWSSNTKPAELLRYVSHGAAYRFFWMFLVLWGVLDCFSTTTTTSWESCMKHSLPLVNLSSITS